MAFSWDQYRDISEVLTIVDKESYSFHKDQHWVKTRPIQFSNWIQFLNTELNFLQLIELHAIEVNDHLDVYYHLQNIEQHQRLNLIVSVYKNEILPSVTDIYPAAEWMEKELIENCGWTLFNRVAGPFFGAGDEENYDLPRVAFNPNRSEAAYPEENYKWEFCDINKPDLAHLFGAKVCYDGEKLTGLIPTVGMHRVGWDNLLNSASMKQQIGFIDQINLNSAPCYSILMTKVYEDIANIKIPERAQAIRMMFIELSRIVEHLLALGQYCSNLGLETEGRILLSCREKVFELYEKHCGRRSGTFISRIGGVAHDLPYGWNIEFNEFEKALVKFLINIRNKMRGTSSIHEQKTLAQITAGQAIRWSVTGPVLRASGINFDLRKSRPMYFYSDIEFDIPVGINGTNYDRLLLRIEEILESLRIIVQVMDNLPLGEFSITDEQREQFLSNIQVSSFFTSFEAGNGELGIYYLKNDKMNFKIRTPSLTNAQALPIILDRVPKKYLTSTLGLLGLSRSEIDR